MRRTDLEAAKTTCGLTVPTHCHADNWWRVQKFQLLVLAPPHAEQGVYETGLAAGGAARKLLLAQSLVSLISRPSRPCPYSVEQMYSASPGFRSRSTSTLSDYTGAIDRFVLLRDRSPARQPNTLSSNFADRLTACHPWSQGESDVGLSRYTLVKRGQPPRYRQLPRRLPRIFIWIC